MVWIAIIVAALIGGLMIRYWYVPFLLNPESIDLRKLGLRVEREARQRRVSEILSAFFEGFNAMLSDKRMANVRARCDRHPPLLQPFAHEGAAMAFGVKSFLKFGRGVRGFEEKMRNLSHEFYFMYNIGLGFCAGKLFKRFPAGVRYAASQLDVRYRYLCFDGFGFQTGLFDYLKNPDILQVFSKFEGYARHACFQGFGRSLWFLFMDAPESIKETIAMQEPDVRGDCYAGLGLAVTFTNMDGLRVAFDFAKEIDQSYLPDYFLGLTIALYARRAMNAAYLNQCVSSLDAASRAIVDAGLESCDRNDAEVSTSETDHHYEVWRRRIAEDLRSTIAPRYAGAAS